MGEGRSPVGANIKAALAERSVSQESLARRLDVTLRTVSNWCNGVTEPKYADVQAVADELGVANVAWFYTRHGEVAA
jgi:transcriptional regulator with XRE-family HTH domain